MIELDGGQHADAADADDKRTGELASFGYRVIRFWNNDVLDNLEGVMNAIRRELESPTSPYLSAPKGGEEQTESRSADFPSPSPPLGRRGSG